MKRLLYLALFLFLTYSIYLGAYSVLHGELNFFNDVARDFLLLQELDQKKIVFIGPRSSTNGLFHGPLLTYIDYPAYLLGQGNPVAVAWFWVGMGTVFLITSFFMIKKLFGMLPAAVFVLLVSVKMAPHLNGVFEPEAMYFVMPAFLFSIIQYVKTGKWKYLVFHLIITAVFIQLSIGIGIQFLMLSTPIIFYLIYKQKSWKHLFSFLVIPIFTANYIIFDIRHDFRMARALLGTGESTKFFISLPDWISNRFQNIFSLQLLEGNHNLLPFLALIFIILMFCTALEIKKSKQQRPIYILFTIYYFGYYALSYFNKGVLLFHYIYLLVPFTILWLVSFLEGRYKILFAILILIVYILNLQSSISYSSYLRDGFIGKNPYSWLGLSSVAQEVISQQKGKEFGYFVYAPDAYAYQPRYAMMYNFKSANAKASEYVKESTTYVIAAPAPPDKPYMGYEWWIKNSAKISNKPVRIEKFPNGYTTEMYHLTPQEQKIPFDPNIELGIHFR